jgi:hypothetical protein
MVVEAREIRHVRKSQMHVKVMILVCAAALAGCSPSIPDSAAGVGFDDYDAYEANRRARDAALTGSALPPPNAVSTETLGSPIGAPASASSTGNDPASLAAEARAALAETEANSGEPVLHANPNNPPPRTVATALGISAENDFDAVGAERSIESDAALIEQNRAQYQVIAPTALPTRSGPAGPNIVQYALSQTHPVGTKVYSRGGIGTANKNARNCARYASADQAQIDFLEKGGPERDRLALDPDGDGYACGWDPTPFRRAVSGGTG